MADVVFTLTGEDTALGEDLRSLDAWLRNRDEVDADIELRVRPPGPGEMGGQPDAVMVAAASAMPIASAFFSWLKERVRSRQVSLVLEDAEHDRRLEVSAGSVEEVHALMPAIKRFFNDFVD